MLLPWAEGPFDLLLHGELHYRAGEDFDRRMALISFDNAVEVSIATYLGLNPALRRDGRQYPRELVERWKSNFHTKLEFLESECVELGIPMIVERRHFVWYHDQRNDQYHEGRAATPTRLVLDGVRRASLWVFDFLYEVPNIESEIDERISTLSVATTKVPRDPNTDLLINEYCGDIIIGDFTYTASELLYSHDPEAYRALGIELQTFAVSDESA
jgi:hypothetical protein